MTSFQGGTRPVNIFYCRISEEIFTVARATQGNAQYATRSKVELLHAAATCRIRNFVFIAL